MIDRTKRNYDHPDAFDLDLLYQDIDCLKDNRKAKIPVYDYRTHTRTSQVRIVEPTDIIIIDGILVLYLEKIRNLLDLKIFIEIDELTSLKRRVHRIG